MRRINAIAMALLVPALLTGCDDDDDLIGVNQDVVGDFQATNFGFTGTADPSLARDFDADGSTFTLSLRNDGTFESSFADAAGAAPMVRTGTFTTTGNQIMLGNQALFPGAQDMEQRFIFQRTTNGLTLESAIDTRFDFNEDDTFATTETARFEGEFTRF